MIQIKRIYETIHKDDGYRILVDRLWPRGLSKETAHIDLWLKDIAPSNELRKWFGHKEEKWEEFRQKYKDELENKDALLKELRFLENKYKVITLLYGAKDTLHNQAVILKEVLE